MPHLSRHKVASSVEQELERHVQSLLEDMHTGRRKGLFRELFTKTERMMLAKRLAMLLLISRDVPTLTVCSTLRVSPSTVARFEHDVERGKYVETVAWFGKYRAIKKMLRLLGDIASIPFDTRGTSLRSLLAKEKKYTK